MVLLYSPQTGKAGWVHYLEYPSFHILPGDEAAIPLCGIVEELLEKIPQQAPVYRCEKNKRC